MLFGKLRRNKVRLNRKIRKNLSQEIHSSLFMNTLFCGSYSIFKYTITLG